MDPQLVNYNGQLINLNGGVLSNKFPIRDGLVFYLDPGVDKCYPDTGTTATDLSPSGITTYVQNGVTFNSNNKGYFEFDGIDDHLKTTGDAVDLTHTDKYTLNLWFRLDDYNSSVKLMVEHSTIANHNPGAWFIDHSEYGVDGSLQFNAVGTGGWNISWTDDPYDDNIWHLYSVTYDASLSALDCVTHYLDGEVVAHTHHPTSNLRLDLNNFGLKKDLYFNSRAGSNFFSNHDLGLFQIYDRVLSQDEIRSIYNHHKQRFEHIITDGLVLNLDAQSKFSYPGTGTTWSDLSPSGNDATLVNGPTYQSEPAAIVFDGVNDYGYVDCTSIFDTGEVSHTFTVSTWARATTSSDSIVLGMQNSGHRLYLGHTLGNWDFGWGGTGWGETAKSPYFSVDDSWTNLVIKVDNGVATLYVNNQESISKTDTTVSLTLTFPIGAYFVNGAYRSQYNYPTEVAEVQVYDRALTDDEIAYNFEARRGRYGI